MDSLLAPILEAFMPTWLILLIAAVIAAVIGLGTAAKWLFIIAIVLLIIGVVSLSHRKRAGP
jgi:uncharacterized membrane protein YtjA (UPF0391 family)